MYCNVNDYELHKVKLYVFVNYSDFLILYSLDFSNDSELCDIEIVRSMCC